MMPDPKGSLVKTIEVLATQKAEVATEVKELIETLDAALRPLGYRVVPAAGGVLTGRRRGRPPGSKKGKVVTEPKAKRRTRGRRSMSAAERNSVSRRMKAYWAKRKKMPAKKAAVKKSS
jgi:hypothetical protein